MESLQSSVSFLKIYLKRLLDVGGLDVATALLTAFLVLSVLAGLFYIRENPSGRPTLRRFSDPATCLKILRSGSYDDTLGINQLTLEESRAIPNQRLVRAFQIDNGFTTTNPAFGRQFSIKASQKLRDVTRRGWSDISNDVQDFASTYFEKYESQNKGRLDIIVQVITLKVVLSMFFGVHEATDHAVIRTAQEINSLWIQSKSSSGRQSCDIRYLQSTLNSLGLGWTNNANNPLNMLLPVYETLWRVVVRCLIEIVFRPSADSEWLRLLRDFRRDPSSENFKPQPGQAEVTVLFLVKEALRLYPPTRRIYRQVHLASMKEPELVAADIEECHRLPHIWGEDSHRYRPARWISADQSMRCAFMPFGGRPWICPANADFGPMLIGVLVAALASIISAEEWELQLQSQLPNDGSQVLDDDVELDSNRRENSASAWMIIRRST
ncbi:MAG: hypothetical protein Q9184_005240 [Pyrenodesmia sp. 2 TL-2023]